MAAAASGSQVPAAKRARKEAPESIVDALNAGREPKVVHQSEEVVLHPAAQEVLEGITVGEPS